MAEIIISLAMLGMGVYALGVLAIVGNLFSGK